MHRNRCIFYQLNTSSSLFTNMRFARLTHFALVEAHTADVAATPIIAPKINDAFIVVLRV